MTENRTEMKRREYLMGDMSEIVGISRDTLRFYEKKRDHKSRKRKWISLLSGRRYPSVYVYCIQTEDEPESKKLKDI